MVGKFSQQFLGARKTLVDIPLIRRLEIGDGLADHAANAGLVHHAAHLGFEVVHVGDRGDAALDQFEGRERRARPHHVGRDELALHRQHVAVEPVVHVLAEAAKQRLPLPAARANALALDWAEQGVRVNAIAYGFIMTDLTNAVLTHKHIGPKLLARTAMGRFGTVEEVGGAAVFLASDAASYVTGSTVLVDGGWTAG